MATNEQIRLHFSDYFELDTKVLNDYGAFNISLINDLPLFIDPFLLFNSKKPEYQALHSEIIKYLRFLRDKSTSGKIAEGLLKSWFEFREVKQTWLGFSKVGNGGRGPSRGFARDLNRNLGSIFLNFGNEQITAGSHLEKLALIREGVGKDKISDFTTGLIKGFLLEYTQKFTRRHIENKYIKKVSISKVRFNYDTETWVSESYDLPYTDSDYVILTPKDLLTRDDTWINRSEFVDDYERIVLALPNDELRGEINNYLLQTLPDDSTQKERRIVIKETIRRYPQVIEYFIQDKEARGDAAKSSSEERVSWSENFFVKQAGELALSLSTSSSFYELQGRTVDEAKERLRFLKDVIENKGGWRLFFVNGEPIRKEEDLHILYRLVWYGTPSDVSREVDDGRGPADFKISRGASDKTIVEFKLASNSQLKRNLQKQTEIYQEASGAQDGLKAIMYFTEKERDKVLKILQDLGLQNSESVTLIDARSDNKPSASKA